MEIENVKRLDMTIYQKNEIRNCINDTLKTVSKNMVCPSIGNSDFYVIMGILTGKYVESNDC